MIEVKRFVTAFEQATQMAIHQRNAQLGKGQCANHEEYKLKVGEIRGLEAASGMARDMLRQMEVAEDNMEMEQQAKKAAGGKK